MCAGEHHRFRSPERHFQECGRHLPPGGDPLRATIDTRPGRHQQHECEWDDCGARGGEGVRGGEGGVCFVFIGVWGHAHPAESGGDDAESEVAVCRVETGWRVLLPRFFRGIWHKDGGVTVLQRLRP